MKDYQMHCYSLNRQTTFRAMYEYRFPCSLHDAIEFLALFLNIKSLMLPAESNMAYATLTGPFFVRKVSIGDVVRFNFNCRYPVPAKNRWFHLLRRLIAFVPAVIHLDRVERMVPETIIEVFATANGILLKGPLSETADDGMLLASIHLWSKNDTFTHAGIFLGWHENSPPDDVQMLHKLVQKYAANLIKLFDPDGEPTFYNSYTTPSTGIDQLQFASDSLERLEKPTDDVGNMDSPGKSALHRIGILEGRSRIMKPHRFYSGTVAKICQMVAFRQRYIDADKGIKDLGETRERIGPSFNTMRKLPELNANWGNPAYRWYVDIWLREQTAHTPAEISQIMSDLREQLTPEDWDLVISTPGGKQIKRVPQNGANRISSYS